MKIRLLQLDGKFPNIALMKISTYYKRKGFDVNWYDPLFDRYDTDKLFVSKIFDFTSDYQYYPFTSDEEIEEYYEEYDKTRSQYIKKCEIEEGGTGFDIYKTLPFTIEIITDLDYSLYPDCNYSVQFYSRGCPNHCEFCVVPDKEGGIMSTSPFSLNPNGKWIEVLDNNFFAAPRWEEAINDLITINQPVNFHGVELDTINETVANYLNKVKLHKRIHIAWDDPKARPQEKMREILQWIKAYKIMCYVLIGFNSNEEEDVYRVEELRKLDIQPFAMPYNKFDQYQKDFTRYVNFKAIFKSVSWKDYRGRKK